MKVDNNYYRFGKQEEDNSFAKLTDELDFVVSEEDGITGDMKPTIFTPSECLNFFNH